MAAAEQDYLFRNQAGVLQNVELMLNNEERSDVMFIVNYTRYHALSHLVAMSSNVLEGIMKEHFENCIDREIQIRNVKNEESFFLVLCFIYGVNMNFTQTNINVLCEALNLAENYRLADFSKELKSYITAKIGTFQIDVIVVLLNTAKKFNLAEMYEKLKNFAYENAEQIVKHESFVDIQYDVLVDLLPSDWFYAKEIDILTGVLQWADDMEKSDGKVTANDLQEKAEDNENCIEDQDADTCIKDADGEVQSIATDCDTDLAESIDTLSVDEEESKEVSTSNATASKSPELSNNGSLDSDLVTSFRENVLKSLLAYIRAPRILAVEHMKAFKTELFVKYNHVLSDYKYLSQSSEPRKKPVLVENDIPSILTPIQIQTNTTALSHNKVFAQSVTFTINRLSLDTVYESKETFQIGHFLWKMDLKEFSKHKDENVYFDIHLSCTTDKEGDWECVTECRLVWNRRVLDYSRNAVNHIYFPDLKEVPNLYKTLTFTSKLTRQYCGQFSFNLSQNLYAAFIDCDKNLIRMSVNFKAIHYKFQ